MDFSSYIPEEFREDPSIKGIPATDDNFIPTLIKNYVNAEKLIGAKRIALPGENASADDMNAFYTAIGRPESADKYEFTLKEGMVKDEEFEKYFRDKFFKRGLSASMAKGVIEDWNEFVLDMSKKSTEALTAKQTEDLAGLQKEYGKAFDQNIAAARKAVDALGIPELKPFLDEKGLANYIPLVKAFVKIGLEHYSEDSQKGGGSHGFILTPEQAKTEVAKLLADADFSKAYNNKLDTGHAEAISRMEKLFAQAYPENQE